MKTIQAGWKGILLCLAIAVPAWFLVEFVPALEVVGAPVIAILAGMLLSPKKTVTIGSNNGNNNTGNAASLGETDCEETEE